MESSRSSDCADRTPPGSVSSGLLNQVKAQDPEAWQRLVRLFGPVVYGWCRQSGIQAADASDMVQETFRAVAVGVDGFHRSRPGDSFRGWLWTITRNKMRDHFRDHQGLPTAQGGTAAQHRLLKIPERPPKSSTSYAKSDDAHPVHRGLELIRAQFEDHTWQAFWRTTVDQQPAAAVADELDMTPAAVYQAKSRVMRRIRRELGDLLQ